MIKGIVTKPGGIFWVRVRIPADVRYAFDGRAEHLESLKTRDAAEAAAIGGPIVRAIHDKIAAARSGETLPETVKPGAVGLPVTPARVAEAFANWRRSEIDRYYADIYAKPFEPHDNPDERAVAALRYSLDQWQSFGDRPGLSASDAALVDVLVEAEAMTAEEAAEARAQPASTAMIDQIDAKMVQVLSGAGMLVTPGHAVVSRERRTFVGVWMDILAHASRFHQNDFTGWPEDAGAAAVPATAQAPLPGLPAAAASGMKLADLKAIWVKVAKPAEGSIRGMDARLKRLAEFLGGDPDVATITRPQMDAFIAAMDQWPKTKKPLDHLTFNEVIEAFGGEEADYDRLEPITIWGNWLVPFARMFGWAVDRDYMAKQPLLLPPKPKGGDRRFEMGDAEIAELFSRPLFQGAEATHQNGQRYGYCLTPGDQIVKDAYYWLPLLGLWSGNRVEEFAGAKAADIKCDDGVWFIDLRGRQVKNEGSVRPIPIHQKLIDLGFIEYVQRQPAEGWLFPDLPHKSGEKSSRQFTKWWSHWRKANATVEGEGIGHRLRPFHSLRHTFKRGCREAGLDQEKHDLLTGHVGGRGVGGSYGARFGGKSLKALNADLQRVDFPTFPALP